jgi:hypothetical protein
VFFSPFILFFDYVEFYSDVCFLFNSANCKPLSFLKLKAPVAQQAVCLVALPSFRHPPAINHGYDGENSNCEHAANNRMLRQIFHMIPFNPYLIFLK